MLFRTPKQRPTSAPALRRRLAALRSSPPGSHSPSPALCSGAAVGRPGQQGGRSWSSVRATGFQVCRQHLACFPVLGAGSMVVFRPSTSRCYRASFRRVRRRDQGMGRRLAPGRGCASLYKENGIKSRRGWWGPRRLGSDLAGYSASRRRAVTPLWCQCSKLCEPSAKH